MKTPNKHIVLQILILFIGFGCEKEIKINLKGEKPKTVIEAVVTNQEGPGACKVVLSKSHDFYTLEKPKFISGAHVSIFDDEGNSEVLTETDNGVYLSNELVGIPGNTYTMEVIIDQDVFTSTSKMKKPIDIDSISVTYNNELYAGFDEAGYILECHYSDKNPENLVGIFVQKNGEKADEVYLSNGLFGFQIDVTYQPGDEAIIELRNLNKEIYSYYEALNKLQGVSSNPMSLGATPANPKSNISNDALGCFAVYPVSISQFIVTEP